MALNIFSGAGGDADENTQVVTRAIQVHGLEEYKETSEEILHLREQIEAARTKLQRRDLENEINRHECRQDALRSAAVILARSLSTDDSANMYQEYEITEADEAKVNSGLTNPRQCPSHELARFLVEQAQSDFIKGRADFV